MIFESFKRVLERKKYVLLYLFCMTFAGTLCIGGALLYILQDFQSYKESEHEYEEVEENFVEFEGDSEVFNTEAVEEYSSVESNFTTEVPKEYEKFPKMNVNHTALRDINPDYVGWLYIPVLEISYPVVKGIDNDYYLTHTFQNSVNDSGAIFVDAYAEYYDFDYIFYGHSMKDGSMFQKLKKFDRDASLCKTDPYMYFYTDGWCYKFEIYSYYVTTVDSPTYMLIPDNMAYKTFVDYNVEKSNYKPDHDLNYNNKSITLSTCYGTTGEERYVVNAIYEDVYSVDYN